MQAIGRLYRPLQGGWVIFYQLVLKDSPDVFLNNLSYRKVAMHNAFLKASPVMRTPLVIFLIARLIPPFR